MIGGFDELFVVRTTCSGFGSSLEVRDYAFSSMSPHLYNYMFRDSLPLSSEQRRLCTRLRCFDLRAYAMIRVYLVL